MATLRAIIELEELNKDTDMTKKVILSAKKVLAFYGAGEERVTQLLTALRDKFSSMIDSVQHYRSAVTRRDKLWVLFHHTPPEIAICAVDQFLPCFSFPFHSYFSS